MAVISAASSSAATEFALRSPLNLPGCFFDCVPVARQLRALVMVV
jgi:hypothetical protein